jgi:NAD(P)-dependent dehydrogenase (short-subunit alcohol dehydrogenase family)
VISDSKVVVVTGSAGGIGRAITAKLEHHGHRVVGLDRSGGRPGSPDRQIDMADTNALLSVAHDLAGGYEIGALVHNAAVQPMGAVGETSVADWIEALRVNVLAADVLAGAFRRSLAAQGGAVVVVNAIAPGAVDTAKLREGFDRWGPDLADKRREVLRERTALGRIADPCEIAEVVDFLLGPQSAFMTGSILTIDGGASARLGSE